MSMNQNRVLLDIDELKTHYFTPQGTVKAVEGASLSIREGQAVGIVGESGCGKSVMLRSIVKMAQELGLAIIADGAENETDAQALAEFGCEYAQGTAFGDPMSMLQARQLVGAAPEAA